MASPELRNHHQHEAPEPPLMRLTDDLLADILIRVPTLADLGSAAAACPAFRRVITDHSFLRRVRAVHQPLLLGALSVRGGTEFVPAQPHHPSAAVARAFAAAADFSCSFLPSPDLWRHRDFRDGRALLSKLSKSRVLVKDYAVCDVLHRRYLLLPAIPDHLADLADRGRLKQFDPFLAPCLGNEHEVGTSFRVICLAECLYEKLVLFPFSSSNGQWHAAEFDGWSALITPPMNQASNLAIPELYGRHFAHGCFCWVMIMRDKLLVLDTRTMEFSSVDTPPVNVAIHPKAIVEESEGRFGMFDICSDGDSGISNLSYSILRNDVQSANQWQSKAKILLPVNYHYDILGVAGAYLLVLCYPHFHCQDLIIPISEKAKHRLPSAESQDFSG